MSVASVESNKAAYPLNADNIIRGNYITIADRSNVSARKTTCIISGSTALVNIALISCVDSCHCIGFFDRAPVSANESTRIIVGNYASSQPRTRNGCTAASNCTIISTY